MTTDPTGPPTAAPRREGDQLRGELLDAATALALTPRPVTIPSLRAVARACGVSATAVYRHFSSQSALTRALLTTHHQAFEATVLHADDPTQNIDARLRHLAREYVRWGLNNPGMYQLLFESADQLDPASTLGDVTHEVTELTHQLLLARRTHSDAPMTPDETARQTERFWFGVHGIVSLRIHKPGQPWLTDPEAEAERLIDHLP